MVCTRTIDYYIVKLAKFKMISHVSVFVVYVVSIACRLDCVGKQRIGLIKYNVTRSVIIRFSGMNLKVAGRLPELDDRVEYFPFSL